MEPHFAVVTIRITDERCGCSAEEGVSSDGNGMSVGNHGACCPQSASFADVISSRQHGMLAVSPNVFCPSNDVQFGRRRDLRVQG